MDIMDLNTELRDEIEQQLNKMLVKDDAPYRSVRDLYYEDADAYNEVMEGMDSSFESAHDEYEMFIYRLGGIVAKEMFEKMKKVKAEAFDPSI